MLTRRQGSDPKLQLQYLRDACDYILEEAVEEGRTKVYTEKPCYFPDIVEIDCKFAYSTPGHRKEEPTLIYEPLDYAEIRYNIVAYYHLMAQVLGCGMWYENHTIYLIGGRCRSILLFSPACQVKESPPSLQVNSGTSLYSPDGFSRTIPKFYMPWRWMEQGTIRKADEYVRERFFETRDLLAHHYRRWYMNIDDLQAWRREYIRKSFMANFKYDEEFAEMDEAFHGPVYVRLHNIDDSPHNATLGGTFVDHIVNDWHPEMWATGYFNEKGTTWDAWTPI